MNNILDRVYKWVGASSPHLTTREIEGKSRPEPLRFFCLKFPDGSYSANSLSTSEEGVVNKFKAFEYQQMMSEGYKVVECVLQERLK